MEFLSAGQLTSGNVPPNSPSVPPFYLHNSDLYTCGSSVSVANEAAAGTLGCLLTDGAGVLYALSNNHVFASNNYAEVGIPIIAPGQSDIRANSLDPFTLGHLHAAMPLIDGNPNIVDATTNVDAAVIKLVGEHRISSMQRGYYDTPSDTSPIMANMVVEKVGRTTGRTTGIVRSLHITPQWIKCFVLRHGTFKFISFINFWGVVGQSGAFSKSGDSGSLVTTRDAQGKRFAVGLVFAGEDQLSLIVPIQQILAHFDLTLLSGHNT